MTHRLHAPLQVVGRTSSWIDVDSPDVDLARQSEVALRQQLEWAAFLSLHACVLPLPPRVRNNNFASIVNQVRHFPLHVRWHQAAQAAT